MMYVVGCLWSFQPSRDTKNHEHAHDPGIAMAAMTMRAVYAARSTCSTPHVSTVTTTDYHPKEMVVVV